MFRKTNEFTKAIIELLDDANEAKNWAFTPYRALHSKTGLELWIANGSSSLECTSCSKIEGKLYCKSTIWRTLLKIKDRNAVKLIKKALENV